MAMFCAFCRKLGFVTTKPRTYSAAQSVSAATYKVRDFAELSQYPRPRVRLSLCVQRSEVGSAEKYK